MLQGAARHSFAAAETRGSRRTTEERRCNHVFCQDPGAQGDSQQLAAQPAATLTASLHQRLEGGGQEESPARELKLERERKKTEGEQVMTKRCEDLLFAESGQLARITIRRFGFSQVSSAVSPLRHFHFQKMS